MPKVLLMSNCGYKIHTKSSLPISVELLKAARGPSLDSLGWLCGSLCSSVQGACTVLRGFQSSAPHLILLHTPEADVNMEG